MPWTIAKFAPPRRVRILLQESIHESPACPLVQVGERVLRGQKIAEASNEHSVSIHASISGKVNEIGEAIEILSDGKDEAVPGLGEERVRAESLEPLQVAQLLQDSGVVSLFPFLSHPIDTVIVNGCESEPYLTSEHCLMMSHPTEILKGCEILRRALGAEEVLVALEDNKEEIAELLRSKIFLHARSHIQVEVLPSRYPQGNDKILIRELLGRSLKNGDPSAKVGAAVFDIPTVYATFEAVLLEKPFYETAVTLGGECVAQPQNVWVRVGTLVEDAVKYARGFLREPAKVILGGPMTGRALPALSVPVLKKSRAILGLPNEVAKPESIEPCIRCGRCVESCPVSISPAMITLAAERELFDLAQDHGAHLCIECGNCAYVCPAKRPMVELIQYANAHS